MSPRFWLILSLLLVVLDQLTKWWAVTVLHYHQPIAILPMVNFTLVTNAGAAFGLLSDASGWQRWFFIVFAVIIGGILLYWIWWANPFQQCYAAALAMVLGGAIGNLIDRIHLGYVIDFIDVYYKSTHWPVFNIADSAITLGVVLLLYDQFFKPPVNGQ